MRLRLRIVAVLLLAWSTGWSETIARVPATQPAESLERRAFRASVDWRHAGLVLEAAEAWGLSPFVLLALLWEESRLDPTAVCKRSGAVGVSQFTWTGRRGLERIRRARGDHTPFTRADALDPVQAIPAAAELLSSLVDRWGLFLGTMHYNGGAGKRGFARAVFRRVDQLRAAGGLPPMREELMGRKKKVKRRPLNVTRQGVPDLNHLGGPRPRAVVRVVIETCHQCGRDSEMCGCWRYPAAAGGARPNGAPQTGG